MHTLNDTHPDFQASIKRIADVAKMSPEDVFAIWREYSASCLSSDQSAVLGEFVDWYSAKLGGDRAALIVAILP